MCITSTWLNTLADIKLNIVGARYSAAHRYTLRRGTSDEKQILFCLNRVLLYHKMGLVERENQMQELQRPGRSRDLFGVQLEFVGVIEPDSRLAWVASINALQYY
ncbi:hypothetical protein KQX54_021581 [Cotesia glomerata]|uniref:Uncharacterized protein n=1 Tax=Cotesia glomerata TaxID=32391 RepID=A0AAV7J729_COTGL|nr:hypothetical protein KQX54_021581 [Cotesia glomerata]